jgi:hypothetical protein
MTIASLSTSSSYSTYFSRMQQGISGIFDALKAGDIDAAKKAYAASGLPAMPPSNATPLGRLYQALQSKDLATAQSAASDLNFKPTIGSQSAKPSANAAGAVTSTTSAAKKAEVALADAKTAIDSSNLFTYMDDSSNADSNIFSMLNVGKNIDLSA